MKNRNWMWVAAAGGALLAARSLQKRLGYSFRGKNVFITGGSRGLGLVLARQLAAEGATVAICARDLDELDRAHRQIAELGGTVIAIPCDVSVRADIEAAISDLEHRLGGLDVLINNAGIISVGPIDTMRVEDCERIMAVNFWGALYASLAALPGMRRRGDGRIVNISSIGGKISIPHMAPYSASKFALAGFSRGLQAEEKINGIKVTTVFPGLMRTGSPRNAEFKGQHDKEFAWFQMGDSLPVSSMNAERAGAQILNACRRGDAEVVLSIQAKTLALLESLMPNTSAAMMSGVNTLLPDSNGDTSTRQGKQSRRLVPDWTVSLDDAAAQRNNEGW